MAEKHLPGGNHNAAIFRGHSREGKVFISKIIETSEGDNDRGKQPKERRCSFTQGL